MSSLNRKDFLVLTISSAAIATFLEACSDDPVAPGGTGGTGTGTAGTGTGGTGTAGTGPAPPALVRPAPAPPALVRPAPAPPARPGRQRQRWLGRRQRRRLRRQRRCFCR